MTIEGTIVSSDPSIASDETGPHVLVVFPIEGDVEETEGAIYNYFAGRADRHGLGRPIQSMFLGPDKWNALGFDSDGPSEWWASFQLSRSIDGFHGQKLVLELEDV